LSLNFARQLANSVLSYQDDAEGNAFRASPNPLKRRCAAIGEERRNRRT
jgi:hypothetical protein